MSNVPATKHDLLIYHHPLKANALRGFLMANLLFPTNSLCTLQYKRHALSTADAKRRQAIFHAPFFHLHGQRISDPGTRAAEGMPDCDCPAVDVADILVDTQFFNTGQSLSSESLI